MCIWIFKTQTADVNVLINYWAIFIIQNEDEIKSEPTVDIAVEM